MKKKETLFDILLKVSELRIDIETAETMIRNAENPQLTIPRVNNPVNNRTFSVDEVKILLEKQKQACANEFIHAEITMEQAKRRVLNAPTVSF